MPNTRYKISGNFVM